MQTWVAIPEAKRVTERISLWTRESREAVREEQPFNELNVILRTFLAVCC
jgi:hypothetical protein